MNRVRLRLVVAVLAISAVAGPAHAATITSGPATAITTSAPWGLQLTLGGPVLKQVATTGSGPTGTLGFNTTTGWAHATRVLSERADGNAHVVQLATTDPLGRRLDVRIEPDVDGVIALSATVTGGPTGDVLATGIAFGAEDKGERFLGFGERSNAVDQRGVELESYVSDGPYQREERPFVAALVPTPGFRFRDDATYFPIPWLLSTRGYGVLVDDDTATLHRLATDKADAWSVETAAARLRLRFFAGPKPADAVRRMSARLGRQPEPEAPFFFGPWVQGKGTDEANLKTLADAGAPTSVWQTYTHYLPCADQTGKTAQERARVAKLHAAGLAVTTYFNPMICTNHPKYGEATRAGLLTKDATGRPYEYRYQGSTQFLVGQFDFTAPGVDAFFGNLFQEAVNDGHDGWMEDFGEYTPMDSTSADGTPAAAMHNRYVELYHRSVQRFSDRTAKPLARFNRSGWTGAAKSSQIVWGGDPTTDWGFDGLESSMWQGMTMGMSGVSMWGSDIGGFFALGTRGLTSELLARWIELGFASGVMRTQANGFNVPEKPRPQLFDKDLLPIWTRYARLRTQMYPYLAAAQATYGRTGLPMMRHLALVEPDDPKAVKRDDEYMLGGDLLVAPVVRPGQTKKPLYLPKGDWIDFWRSTSGVDTGGLRLGAPTLLEGGREVELPAPRDELPMMARAGAILPLVSSDVDTLTDYGDAPGLVKLADRADVRRLLVFPRGSSRADLGPEGGRAGSHERNGRWILRIADTRQRRWEVEATLSSLNAPFKPCRITVGYKPLSRKAWSYDAATGVLRMTLQVKKATVRVESRRCR